MHEQKDLYGDAVKSRKKITLYRVSGDKLVERRVTIYPAVGRVNALIEKWLDDRGSALPVLAWEAKLDVSPGTLIHTLAFNSILGLKARNDFKFFLTYANFEQVSRKVGALMNYVTNAVKTADPVSLVRTSAEDIKEFLGDRYESIALIDDVVGYYRPDGSTGYFIKPSFGKIDYTLQRKIRAGHRDINVCRLYHTVAYNLILAFSEQTGNWTYNRLSPSQGGRFCSRLIDVVLVANRAARRRSEDVLRSSREQPLVLIEDFIISQGGKSKENSEILAAVFVKERNLIHFLLNYGEFCRSAMALYLKDPGDYLDRKLLHYVPPDIPEQDTKPSERKKRRDKSLDEFR